MIKKILVPLLLVFVFFGCKEDGRDLKIHFDYIQGLKEGDRVVFEKNHVGQVTGVSHSKEGYYVVDVDIKREFENAVTEYSRFFIVADSQNKSREAIEITQTPKGGTLLADGATVKGSEGSSEKYNGMWDEFSKGLEGLKRQFEEFSDDLSRIPESEEFKNLQEELDRLAEEMKKKGQEARKKIEKDVLPRLQREMERLREMLRELGREEENEPLKTQLEDIRTI
jgi:preprotein translocase subunit YajC